MTHFENTRESSDAVHGEDGMAKLVASVGTRRTEDVYAETTFP